MRKGTGRDRRIRELTSDPDELDEMIGDLAQEKGLPYGIWPDTARKDDPVAMGWEELHRQSLEWRSKLIKELQRRPDWVAAWRAERELNQRIRELCEERGWTFKLWEVHPAEADDGPSPWPPGTGGYESWPKAQKLRRHLIAELKAQGLMVGAVKIRVEVPRPTRYRVPRTPSGACT
jgi:hypothetical protein